MADQIEVTRRALVAAHESYAAATGSTEGARVWAHDHLFNLDFSGIADPEELEVQVRALSLIAEASYEAATRWILKIWATSPANTGSKATGSAQPSVPKSSLRSSSHLQSPLQLAASGEHGSGSPEPGRSRGAGLSLETPPPGAERERVPSSTLRSVRWMSRA